MKLSAAPKIVKSHPGDIFKGDFDEYFYMLLEEETGKKLFLERWGYNLTPEYTAVLSLSNGITFGSDLKNNFTRCKAINNGAIFEPK